MKKSYTDTVHKQLMSEFSYSNAFAVPNLDKIAVNDVVSFESEALSEVRANHSDLLESIANEKELSKENDDKLKSILDDLVGKFASN